RDDGETALKYYRARYYHPGLQRFISEDPLRFVGGDPNFYAYVRNNPLAFVDPTGLCADPGGAAFATASTDSSLTGKSSVSSVTIVDPWPPEIIPLECGYPCPMGISVVHWATPSR